MSTLQIEFDVPVGYSDHTLGITVPIIAVAMGASVIEKHFTLDKNLQGPDHQASLEPSDLKEMVTQIRLVETALGSSEKMPVESELEIKKVARKSIVAKIDIPRGTLITRNMIAIKRPGTGLSPKYVDSITGKKARDNIKRDEMITANKVE